MLHFALGELKLQPKHLWKLTWREYCALVEGYHRREVAKWKRARFLACITLNVNRAADTPPIEPSELMWLPGDSATTAGHTGVVQLSDDEYAAELARLDALYPVL